MKRKHVLAAAIIIGALLVIDLPRLMSSTCPAFPPAHSCGDPTSTCLPGSVNCTCAQSGCHPSPAQAGGPLTLSLQIVDSIGFSNGTANYTTLDSSFKYEQNKEYMIAFSLVGTTGAGSYGFQLTGLNPDNSMAGNLFVIDTNHAKTFKQLDDTTNIQYISHHNANVERVNSWVFGWQAPATFQPITFYYAYNFSDTTYLDSLPPGVTTPGIPGGIIYSSTVQIQSAVSGINSMNGNISGLNLFPNPVNDDFTISFSVKKSNPVTIGVYSLDGRLVNTLMEGTTLSPGDFSKTFSLNNVAAGVYMVKLNVGDASLTQKITKL